MFIGNIKKIWLVGIMILISAESFNIFCQTNKPVRPSRRNTPAEQRDSLSMSLPDSINLTHPVKLPAAVVEDSMNVSGGKIEIEPVDTFPIADDFSGEFLAADSLFQPESPINKNVKEFSPDPVRAVWMSALFPGLGQLYNRRFWKLPIVVGGFMGLTYGMTWNNMMLRDYTKAYSDIMDNDPNTKSYMDFFPPTVQESDLDKNWLENILKRRKDYYRRNRDLCIISMVGVYLLAMVDAYVDASLAHFDISPDLSMDVAPAFIQDTRNGPGIGLHWAFTF